MLLSGCPSWLLDGDFCSRALQSLSGHLEVTDVEERNAAGEAVALLFTMADLAGAGNEDSADEESGTSFDKCLLKTLSIGVY